MRKIDIFERGCQIFKSLSTKTWNRISTAHSVGVNLSETGITADIVVEILKEIKKQKISIGVYAQKGWSESIYGSDMDIFIEIEPNKYYWFALQEKLLKKNNKYDTLRDGSPGSMQWEKLKKLEKLSGCKAYYLLYNGKFKYFIKGLYDECDKHFKTAQFGCSLVEPNIIEKFASMKDAKGKFINPKFEDFHPVYAAPWREIACCPHKMPIKAKSVKTYYGLNDILYAKRNYDALSKVRTDVYSDYNNLDNSNFFGISEASREAEWNPAITLILQSTTSEDLKIK